MKYFQKTIDGNEVLMDTNGKVYHEVNYRLEFRDGSHFVYIKRCRAYDLEGVIYQMKEFLKEFDDPAYCTKIKSIQIINDTTDQLIKEYKRAGSIKR